MSLTKKSKVKITWIIIFCVVLCTLLALLATRSCAPVSTAWNDESSWYEGDSVQTFDQSYTAADVKKLSIDYPAGKLVIRRASDNSDSIQVVEEAAHSGGRSNLDARLTGDTLTLSYESGPASWFPLSWLFDEKKLLIITLPNDADYKLDALNIHLSSGLAQVNDIHTLELNTEVGSGKATFNSVQATHSNVRLSSGMLSISGSELGTSVVKVSSGMATIEAAVRSINAELSSGKLDLSCTNSDMDSIKASVTSGALTLAVPRTCGFDAAASKTSGSFNCDFDCSVRGDVYTYGDGRVPIDLSVTSGRITLKPLD